MRFWILLELNVKMPKKIVENKLFPTISNHNIASQRIVWIEK